MWANAVFTGVMVAGALGSAAFMYGWRKVYSALRSEGNDQYICDRIRDEMMLKPRWSQAIVYSAVYHAFADTAGQPFGLPFVVPAPPAGSEREADAINAEHSLVVEEVRQFLRELHDSQPQVSFVDLWVCATIFALAAVGGPVIPMKWGRFVDPEDVSSSQAKKGCRFVEPGTIISRPPLVPYSERNALRLKKTLAAKGFTTDEMVALLGHRTLGWHAPPEFRPDFFNMREVLDPDVIIGKQARKVVPSSVPTETNDASSGSGSPPARTFGSSTPGVFNNEYFAALMNGSWTPATTAPSTGGSSWFGSKAQPSPAVQVGTPSRAAGAFVNADATTVLLDPVDVSLLDDAMLRGWAVKFAENELRFFNCFQRGMERILNDGWASAELRDTK